MHPLIRAMELPSRKVIGIMSGTSVDGIDVALCQITGYGLNSKIELLGFYFEPYSEEIRNKILKLAEGSAATAEDFCKINFLFGHLYSRAALQLCRSLKIEPNRIDLIGSHGQTLWHVPENENYLGESFKSTLQLGEFSVLAETFGCPVIGDFRVRDVAAGGFGAPLVPYSEFLIYRSVTESVALQNIGGIGNVTCLPANCSLEDVYAFDTGPGNIIMDAVYSRITNGEYSFDRNGAYAGKGKVDASLLAYLMSDSYIRKAPPKTTGREHYGKNYVDQIMKFAVEKQISDPDLMATVTAFTAESIAYSIKKYFKVQPDKLIIGGGGSNNQTLVHMIKQALPNCYVVTNEEIGFNSDAKEAIAFAVLANETLFANANNVPSVTGAKHPVVMGKISI